MVLFGGEGAAGLLGDTWTWDGGAWKEWTAKAPASPVPPARQSGMMVYDGRTGRVVLFGGEGAASLLGDTWTYAPRVASVSARVPPPPLRFLDLTTPVSDVRPVAEVLSQPGGRVGEPFFAVLHCAGAVGFGIWSRAGGGLPPGLGVRESGALIGVPRKAGTYTFTVRVTDLAGRTATHRLSVTIFGP